MLRVLTASVVAFGIAAAFSTHSQAAPACVQTEPGKLRCAIDKAADCDKINDFPYARELFCAASFASAQAMVAGVAETLGVKAPKDGFFYFFQTLPAPPAPPDMLPQTTTPCALTQFPVIPASKDVVGAGTPLCNLVAYVTSPGPDAKKTRKEDPIPGTLRGYPEYFSQLYAPEKKNELTKFRTKSAFDKLVGALGADGIDNIKKFSPTSLYDPDHFTKDSRYTGISGGGGGGWGGEIAIVGPQGPVVQFAYGGGGGGGMSSYQPAAATPVAGKPNPVPAVSTLGAGGGGGAQFANGYQFGGKSYNGLGLGAGVGSTDAAVQYSYNDYEGSVRPPIPVHQYNAPVVNDYAAQLKNLAAQLKKGYTDGKTIVVRGGGGMGAGTAYLASNGQASPPRAMSTQGGFQFNYEFAKSLPPANDLGTIALDGLNAEQQNIYAVIGDAYQAASDVAFAACGSDFSKFECMCPIQHAYVICVAAQELGDPAKVPGWLQQRHCPGDDPNVAGGFTRYQRLLLASTQNATCTTALTGFFNTQNTPVAP